jgi:hypothetical protein
VSGVGVGFVTTKQERNCFISSVVSAKIWICGVGRERSYIVSYYTPCFVCGHGCCFLLLWVLFFQSLTYWEGAHQDQVFLLLGEGGGEGGGWEGSKKKEREFGEFFL